jgi:hypothetical protein
MTKEPYFLAFGDKQKIVDQYDYMADDISLKHAKANVGLGRTFLDFDGDVSIKSDYNRLDYEYFRSNLSNITPERAIELAQKAYDKVGIIRNIIDTMSELCTQGIRIQHPVRRTERFLQAWFEHVGGTWVSYQFSNIFYRLCNVPVKTAYGTIKWPDEEAWSRSKGGLDNTQLETFHPKKREIPLKYTFIHPNCLEVVGGSAGLFIGKPYYILKVSDTLKQDLAKLNSMNIPGVKEEYAKMLEDVKTSVSKNTRYIILDQDKIDVYHFMKDDWQVWALPYMASIFDELAMLERMKLADMSALDGAISNIRHWKVGIIDPTNPANNILPTKTAINRIRNILANNVGGGTMDLVTGPEVDFKESNTQVHKFLGKEKYVVTLDNIYDGMGIPPPLRSGSSSSGSSTNNYVSLKTLIERLQYGRQALLKFWNKQLKIVQEAMGHKYPGQIVFDQLILADESAQKTALIQLVDRDIISAEAVQEHFGYIPEIEKIRIRREEKDRVIDKMPPRASQFHTPHHEEELKKILLQSGDVTPSELGLELQPRKPDEKPRFEAQLENDVKVAKLKPKGDSLTGRPKNIKETKKRKPKPTAKPRTAKGYIESMIWAEKTYQRISDTLSPAFLEVFSRANARQFTNEETQIIEDIKFAVLCAIQIDSEVTEELINSLLTQNLAVPSEIQNIYIESKANYSEKNGKIPTLEELRKMQIISYLEACFE